MAILTSKGVKAPHQLKGRRNVSINHRRGVGNDFLQNDNKDYNFTNVIIHSINHRGANDIAPENTMSAFRISKELGFDMVECDVDFTKDNIPVIIHDKTVDRTSNGSGDVHSFTFEDIRELDFGSWKSIVYTGEKIPSFEEFIYGCRTLGLHPYIEIKEREYINQNLIDYLIDIVKMYNMERCVTWISFGFDKLEYIHNTDKSARLGYIPEEYSIKESIDKICGLKTKENEVFLDCNYYSATSDVISVCKDKGLPVEVWTVDSVHLVENADPYITGFTSNKLKASNVLRDLYSNDGDDLDFVEITSQVQKTEYVDELLKVFIMRKNGYVFIKCYCTLGDVPANQEYHASEILVTGIPKKYIPYMDVSLAAMGWGYDSDGNEVSKICRISVSQEGYPTPGCIRISESNMVKGDRLRAEWSYPVTYHRK